MRIFASQIKWNSIAFGILLGAYSHVVCFADNSSPSSVPVASAIGSLAKCSSPSGTLATITPLELRNGPANLNQLEITQGMGIYDFAVDCMKKEISVRNPDSSSQTWEVLSDDHFLFNSSGGSVQLTSDGQNNTNCMAVLTANIFGRVDCKSPNGPTIHLESVWWLSENLSARDRSCHFPPGAYLHTVVELRQCGG